MNPLRRSTETMQRTWRRLWDWLTLSSGRRLSGKKCAIARCENGTLNNSNYCADHV